MSRPARWSVLAPMGVAVALIAGCGTGSPVASPTPPTATPTPTPTPASLAFDDLTCADLATPSLSGLLPPETREERDGAWTQTNYLQTLASHYSVASVGGIACEWTSTVPPADEGSGTGRVEVVLLPFATTQFDAWMAADVYHPGACNPDGDQCSRNTLVGSTWVSTAASYTPQTTFDAYATELEDLVAGTIPGAPPSAPETALGSHGCSDIVSGPTLAASLRFEIELTIESVNGNWDVWAAADNLAGTIRCNWTMPASPPQSLGHLSALPGGAWAWDTLSGRLTDPSAPVPLDIPGLDAGDQAWIRCMDTNENCIVDLVLGNDWIEYRLDSRIQPALQLFDARSSAVALATDIVATLP